MKKKLEKKLAPLLTTVSNHCAGFGPSLKICYLLAVSCLLPSQYYEKIGWPSEPNIFKTKTKYLASWLQVTEKLLELSLDA
jgi:hypothetical protein